MFAGFTHDTLDVGEATINFRTGGAGPALLLLHGFPQTHAHWHSLAPLLSGDFTLVIPDLRGYGDSRGPGPDEAHHNHSKRTMAKDMVTLMDMLGFQQFRLAGHDRGGRVAYRLTLDHPERVTHLVSLDTVPTIDIWEAMDMAMAIDAFHWPLLAQPAPVPETLIGGAPEFFLHHLLNRWAGSPGILNSEAVSEYERNIRKPSVIEAMAEDYRAGATIDCYHDQADREAGRKITCPSLVVRGARYSPTPFIDTWQRWASDVREVALDCGHFIAEEDPIACARVMRKFLFL